ncbi:hypothetical protein TNCV_2925311 [Trichonephila clavipes]|nr:hypothetical protein TNCV_2925311 [Trichonephila clavipes]
MIDRHVQTAPTVSLSIIQRTTACPPVGPSAILRRLPEAVLCSQRPLRRLALTPQHRRNVFSSVVVDHHSFHQTGIA